MAGSLSVSHGALEAFRGETSRIIAETVSRALEKKQEVAHHGAEAERIIASGIGFTVRMLDATMAAGEWAFLEDGLRWSMDRLPFDGVSTNEVVSLLQLLREVVKERMIPALGQEVAAVIESMEGRLRELAVKRKA